MRCEGGKRGRERELISFGFAGDKIASSHSGKKYEVLDLGILNPEETPTAFLTAGQVGYVGEFSFDFDSDASNRFPQRLVPSNPLL